MTERHIVRMMLWVGLLVMSSVTGCLMPGPEPVADEPTLALPTGDPAAAAAQPTSTVALPDETPTSTPPPDPNAPAVLIAQELGAGTLSILRFPRGTEVCVAASFNLQTFAASHCGNLSGVGVGFVDSITDPGGVTHRIAYGLALDATMTAVAIEFTGGGNTNTQPQNGGYLFVLQPGQTPSAAFGVNVQGNLVGRWGFE